MSNEHSFTSDRSEVASTRSILEINVKAVVAGDGAGLQGRIAETISVSTMPSRRTRERTASVCAKCIDLPEAPQRTYLPSGDGGPIP
jgi:hypothetical protein